MWGWIFLDWTSTKQGFMCLFSRTQYSDAESSQALYHGATALPQYCFAIKAIQVHKQMREMTIVLKGEKSSITPQNKPTSERTCRSDNILRRLFNKCLSTVSPVRSRSISWSNPSTVRVSTMCWPTMWLRNKSRPISLQHKKWMSDGISQTLACLIILDVFFIRVSNSSSLIFCLFDLILYVPSTIFQLYRDESSWVEPVLS